MPLPFLDAEYKSSSKKGHRGDRENTLIVAQRWVNRLIALFNFYELGNRAHAQVPHIGTLLPSAVQLARANQLLRDLIPWVRARPVAPTGGSRGLFLSLIHI